jgi:hypothetical protein
MNNRYINCTFLLLKFNYFREADLDGDGKGGINNKNYRRLIL